MGKIKKAIIVAGGRGKRLRPMTDFIPKPMVTIAGKPVLEHIINHLKNFGITDFIITICYLPKVITEYFGDGSRFGIHITYLFEDEKKPLGTAGAVKNAQKYLDDTFILTSGDTLRTLDIKKMYAQHIKHNAFVTMNVYKRYGVNPKSMILFDDDFRVSKFVERPSKKEQTADFVWANGFFFIFEPNIFSYIPKNVPSDFGKDILPRLINEKKKVFAFPTDEYFVDIGDTVKLQKAQATYHDVLK